MKTEKVSDCFQSPPTRPVASDGISTRRPRELPALRCSELYLGPAEFYARHHRQRGTSPRAGNLAAALDLILRETTETSGPPACSALEYTQSIEKSYGAAISRNWTPMSSQRFINSPTDWRHFWIDALCIDILYTRT